MGRFQVSLLLFLYPLFAFADAGSVSFSPPPSDLSVIFLSNIFGIVDGVLRGTGSHIMGAMFGLFNAAVFTIGGIIIMYTLMVSTLNTAHEGELLGQKWSSIWIPVRTTLGLALLIPKGSGYCLMQIGVMWLVVQGIGAADKVWEAALSYLNRGGVIIQAQTNPGVALLEGTSSGIPGGAMNILLGQVCMLGMQKQLEAQRQGYLNAKQNELGPCYNPPENMKDFCNTAIPDFINSVNAVKIQNDQRTGSSFSVFMPNFDAKTPYSFLNGICGTITWEVLGAFSKTVPETGANASVGGIILSAQEYETGKLSRAIAIQQMYLDLSSIAQIMVNNSPGISKTGENAGGDTTNYSLVAKQAYGVPYTKSSVICNKASDVCTAWGPSGGTNGSGVLFNGTEFQGAIAVYNGIMMPTLNLIAQANDEKRDKDARNFINDAKSQGWLMAGSYFFDLVKIQGDATKNADKTDKNTGLDKSEFNLQKLLSGFGDGSCIEPYARLCTWFGRDKSKLSQVVALIDGSILMLQNGTPVITKSITKPDLVPNRERALKGGLESSTVYGFINNSVMMQMPGQPGLKPLPFANTINISVDPTMYYLQEKSFPCGTVRIVLFEFCFGQLLGNIFYNLIFRYVYNLFLLLFQQIIQQVVMAFIMIPLIGLSEIFKEGISTISAHPGMNPVVALANMGIHYINFASHLWMTLLNLSIISSLIPLFGGFIFAVIALTMPMLLAWVGIMMGVGMVTSFYIPVLPYMIFTFGTLAWFMSVIEAIVAGPIIALGVIHPDAQHEVFGKSEAAVMILMNVFLRPAMMIIGYIGGIGLSYIGIWILNTGFTHAISVMQVGGDTCSGGAWGMCDKSNEFNSFARKVDANWGNTTEQGSSGSKSYAQGAGLTGYSGFAGIFAYFFAILTYTTLYLIIVQRSFSLIALLPDSILRWIGGTPEGGGGQTLQWGDEAKQGLEAAQDPTQNAQSQIDKQLGAYGQKAADFISDAGEKPFQGKGDVVSKAIKSQKSKKPKKSKQKRDENDKENEDLDKSDELGDGGVEGSQGGVEGAVGAE
jgi:defect in organelle trafficking protein DotA